MGTEAPDEYCKRIHADARQYGGFSLIVGVIKKAREEADGESSVDAWYLSNGGTEPQPIGHGVHGLSNAMLDHPWPKLLVR